MEPFVSILNSCLIYLKHLFQVSYLACMQHRSGYHVGIEYDTGQLNTYLSSFKTCNSQGHCNKLQSPQKKHYEISNPVSFHKSNGKSCEYRNFWQQARRRIHKYARETTPLHQPLVDVTASLRQFWKEKRPHQTSTLNWLILLNVFLKSLLWWTAKLVWKKLQLQLIIVWAANQGINHLLYELS